MVRAVLIPDSLWGCSWLAGRDINLEILRVEGYRKFCNKIFNATKFAMLKLDEEFVPEPTAKVSGVRAYKGRYNSD